MNSIVTFFDTFTAQIRVKLSFEQWPRLIILDMQQLITVAFTGSLPIIVYWALNDINPREISWQIKSISGPEIWFGK